MTATLSLSPESRYKDTRIYDDAGVVSFALMEPPPELVAAIDDVIHTVQGHEVGFLDKIAAHYYGPGYEKLWWIIALVNGIIDAEAELFPGARIRIPQRARMVQFLMRAGRA